jgi:hypothetical protein
MKHIGTKPSPRSQFSFSEPLQQRLNAYALAASAAGMGVLALGKPAEAKIVYTPAHKTINVGQKIALDLNHDGKTDFNFQESFFTTTSVGEFHSIVLAAFPAHKGNDVWGMGNRASALAAGVRVGAKGRFSYGKKVMAVDSYADGTGGSGTCNGLWINAQKRYLGFKFTIKGKTHFGWARLNVSCVNTSSSHTVSGVLTGYAYETIPNKAIITGRTKRQDAEAIAQYAAPQVPTARQEATLGSLAMGSPGLSIWRRKEAAAATSEGN